MRRRTTGRTRPARVLPVVVALALLSGFASTSAAAGTGGIEVTPIPSTHNGKAITTFSVELPTSGSKQIRYTLRNLDRTVRSARVFAAKVTLTGGNFSLGTAGSSPYVSDPDRTVTLQPGQIEQRSFTVKAGPRPPGKVYAAIVVEVRHGSVVQNAATLITLKPAHRQPLPSLPVLLVILAVVAVALAGLGLLVAVRRRQ